jgi:hypothetical protein
MIGFILLWFFTGESFFANYLSLRRHDFPRNTIVLTRADVFRQIWILRVYESMYGFMETTFKDLVKCVFYDFHGLFVGV